MNSKKKKKKKKSFGLIEISICESNYYMFFMEANRSKFFAIIDRRTFYIFPAVFMFCKVNILLFWSLLNMITASMGRWVSGRWSVVGGLVVGGFNKILLLYRKQYLHES